MIDLIVSIQSALVAALAVAIIITWWPIARTAGINKIAMSKIYHIGVGLFIFFIGALMMRLYSFGIREFDAEWNNTIIPVIGLATQIWGGLHLAWGGILPKESSTDQSVDKARGKKAFYAGVFTFAVLFILGRVF